MRSAYGHKDASKENIIGILLASILPVAFVLLWLTRNNQLPGNDASNYLLTAVNIYQHFSDHGFWNGLLHFYGSRGWRPIFFPNLAVPFLLITHGNLYLSYCLTAVSCLIASTIYLYLFFRLMLDRFSAIIATNLIGLLPLVLAQVLMFYAEAALFFCIIGSLYHLIKSDYLRILPHVIGFVILLSLALVIRPVEVVTHLIFVLPVFLYFGTHANVFDRKMILTLIACSFTAILLFFIGTAAPYFHFKLIHVMDEGGMMDKRMAVTILYALIGAAICSLIAWSLIVDKKISRMRERLKSNRSLLVPAFVAIYALVLFWFFPFGLKTFEWVYRTSLGDVASSTGALTGSKFSWPELHKYIISEGTVSVCVITLVGIMGILLMTKQQRRSILHAQPFLYLLLMIPFPFWEAFYTVQVVTRKLSIAFPALLMALLFMGLQRGRWWSERVAIITLLTIAQFVLLLALLFTNTYSSPDARINGTIGYFIPQASVINPNPHDVVIDFLAQQASKYKLEKIGIETDPGTPDARHPVEAEPIDPFLVSMLLQADERPFNADYLYFGFYSAENAKKPDVDAIFLSDRSDAMVVSKDAAEAYRKKFTDERSASLQTYYDFLMHYSANKLAEIGWKTGPCMLINTQRHGEYRGCLILPIKK